MSISASTDAATPPISSRAYTGSRTAKRVIDVAVAIVLLAAVAPLLALIALLVRLDSTGAPIFSQIRIGLGGRRFKVHKFRSMVVDAESQLDALRCESDDPHWLSLKRDPRVTRVGRMLRFTSLDELPQLWNVVRGDMSLVGPRPLTESDDAAVSGSARVRSTVPPGITGLWQISGRADVSFEDMLRLDQEYVANWSLRRDVLLLLRTVPAVLLARGVN